jgi:hypothetical protein
MNQGGPAPDVPLIDLGSPGNEQLYDFGGVIPE